MIKKKRRHKTQHVSDASSPGPTPPAVQLVVGKWEHRWPSPHFSTDPVACISLSCRFTYFSRDGSRLPAFTAGAGSALPFSFLSRRARRCAMERLICTSSFVQKEWSVLRCRLSSFFLPQDGCQLSGFNNFLWFSQLTVQRNESLPQHSAASSETDKTI